MVVLTLALVIEVVSATPPIHARPGPKARKDRLESADWMPLKGRIRLGRTWGYPAGHDFPAIDFTVPAGESVLVHAAGPGTVLTAEGGCRDTTPDGENTDCNEGRGNFVEIVHPDGRRSRYMHLHHGTVTVEPGEYVCRGCPIGRSGWSGNVSPPGPEGGHLHYEELQGFEQIDPGPILAKRPAGRARYPGRGRSWQEVGRNGLVIHNTGYPHRGRAPKGSCFGYAPTREGTANADEIRGTMGPDIILGGDGNDTIYGLSGDDRLCGGSGDDVLDGDSDFDSIDGGDGTDTCYSDDGEAGYKGTIVSCERPPFTLRVEVDCCLRVVTSEPAGISCPPACSAAYAPHTTVTLTLSSGPAYWEGCDNESGTNYGTSCTLIMDEDRTVNV